MTKGAYHVITGRPSRPVGKRTASVLLNWQSCAWPNCSSSKSTVSHEQGAGFSKVPRTFRPEKPVVETATRLFSKAGLLTCFKRKKKQRGLQIKVWWLRTPAFQRYKWNCGTRNRLEKFRNFWETGPSSQFGSNDALHLRTGRFEVSNSCFRLVFI